MSKGKRKSTEGKPVAALDEGEAAAELKRLTAVIAHHDELYYRLDAPEISDAEYDALRERNAAIEARFPHLIRDDSPSLRIGAPPVAAFGKVVHRVPMLSLANVFDDDGVREFLGRIRRFLGLESLKGLDFTTEPKIDGVSLTLRYESGRLVQGPPAATVMRARTSRPMSALCPTFPTGSNRRASPTHSRFAARST
jgi:DNA ligase (NAD+)